MFNNGIIIFRLLRVRLAHEHTHTRPDVLKIGAKHTHNVGMREGATHVCNNVIRIGPFRVCGVQKGGGWNVGGLTPRICVNKI